MWRRGHRALLLYQKQTFVPEMLVWQVNSFHTQMHLSWWLLCYKLQIFPTPVIVPALLLISNVLEGLCSSRLLVWKCSSDKRDISSAYKSLCSYLGPAFFHIVQLRKVSWCSWTLRKQHFFVIRVACKWSESWRRRPVRACRVGIEMHVAFSCISKCDCLFFGVSCGSCIPLCSCAPVSLVTVEVAFVSPTTLAVVHLTSFLHKGAFIFSTTCVTAFLG